MQTVVARIMIWELQLKRSSWFIFWMLETFATWSFERNHFVNNLEILGGNNNPENKDILSDNGKSGNWIQSATDIPYVEARKKIPMVAPFGVENWVWQFLLMRESFRFRILFLYDELLDRLILLSEKNELDLLSIQSSVKTDYTGYTMSVLELYGKEKSTLSMHDMDTSGLRNFSLF